ncbi:MAG: hypothetical protein JWM78_618 [Verrucomicrobiaceae bacterium]|nr:hypothetical protein [Verrucomicrobiaceae bacterium]
MSKKPSNTSVPLPIFFRHVTPNKKLRALPEAPKLTLFVDEADTVEKLTMLAEDAEKFASTPYTTIDDPLQATPATLWRDARVIAKRARECIHLVIGNGGGLDLLSAGYELGRLIEQSQKTIEAWEALRQKKSNRQQRVDAAADRNAEIRCAAVREWLARAPHKRGDKKAFAHEISERYPISFITVYDDWLSKESIKRFSA